jgi:putative flippase GtrA
MAAPRPDAITAKVLRYSGVSVVNLIVGQSLLFMFHSVLGWRAVVANFFAVCLSAAPAYMMSRRWVWRQEGAHSMTNEVLPFWALAVAGLVVSTLAVGFAEEHFDAAIMVNVANIVGFGLVWVVKFVVLEHVMWRTDH